MGATAQWKRTFLRSLFWASEANESPLLDTIKSAIAARVSDTESGTVLIGSSANGASVSFSVPDGGPSPAEMVEVLGELYELYEHCATEAGDGATDPQVVACMLEAIRPIRRFAANFRGVSW